MLTADEVTRYMSVSSQLHFVNQHAITTQIPEALECAICRMFLAWNPEGYTESVDSVGKHGRFNNISLSNI